MMNDNEIESIKEKYKYLIDKAVKIMKEINDAVHGLSHVESVVANTIELLKEENEADKEVCILSAYWHDVGRIYGKEGHGINSAEMLKKELINSNYEEQFIEKCYKAICKHDSKEIPETLEGIIIKDADKIDCVGVERWKTCVKNNQRLPRIVPGLRENVIILDSSKKMHDKNARELIEYLSNIILKN